MQETQTEKLSKQLGELLSKQGLTLAAAESCSGGLLCSEIVSVSGASKYFRGGAISYSNEAKEIFIGVRHAQIEKFGAVSEEVARSMAHGVRVKTGADFGISITGIAGPEGGSSEKPVGTVWVGFSSAEKDFAKLFSIKAERNEFRRQCVARAMEMVIAEVSASEPK